MLFYILKEVTQLINNNKKQNHLLERTILVKYFMLFYILKLIKKEEMGVKVRSPRLNKIRL